MFGNMVKKERVAVDRLIEYKALGAQISATSDFLTDAARQYVQFGEEKYLDLYWQEVNATKTKDNVIARLKEMKTGQKVFDYLQRAVDASNGLIKTEEEAFSAVKAKNYQLARQLIFGEFYNSEKEKIADYIDDFEKAINDSAETEVTQAQNNSNYYKMLSYLSMLLIAISVTTTGIITGRSMRKLKKITQSFDKLATADGDLTARLDFNSNDEIGDIARSFNTFIEKVQQIVQAVSSSCNTVSEQSAAFSSSSNEVVALSDDISHAVDDIANGATELAIQVENGVTALNLLSNNLDTENALIKGVQDNSNDVKGLIDYGIDSINKLVESVNQNIAVSGGVSKVIAETNMSTEQISSASDMIKAIAYQTNLLALNAAIEAARAGESGRGFAVVAEEIRKLAERSSTFAEEISDTIEDLVEKTAKAVAAMNEAEVIIKQQEVEMKNTNDKFVSIVTANKAVIKMVHELQEMSKAIADEKNTIISTMESLSAISEQSAAATEEISASVMQQTRAIKQVSEGSVSLDKNVDVIKSSLDKFNY